MNEKLTKAMAALGAVGIARQMFDTASSSAVNLVSGLIKFDDYRSISVVESFLFNQTKIVTARNSHFSLRQRSCSAGDIGYYPLKIMGEDSQMFMWGNVPLWAKKVKTDYNYVLSIYYIRGTVSPTKFISEATNYYNSLAYKGRFFVRKYVKNSKGEVVEITNKYTGIPPEPGSVVEGYGSIEKRDSLFIPEIDSIPMTEDMRVAKRELETWLKSESWYQEKGLSWRRGLFLYGKPGTGKTTFAMAIAKNADMPVIVMDIGSFANSDLVDRWKSLEDHAPCMVILEDIDATFNGRKNISGNGSSNVNFNCLLNAISGSDSVDGVFLVITTNHPEKVDDALVKVDGEKIILRQGRLDRAVKFGGLDRKGRLKIANRILGDYPEIVHEMVDKFDDSITVASMQEACLRRAVEMFWRKK